MTDGFMSTPISKAYVEKCNTQIAEIVEVVRGNLPAGARMTIGALIVIDVHGNVARIFTMTTTITRRRTIVELRSNQFLSSPSS